MNTKARLAAKQSNAVLPVKSAVRAGGYTSGGRGQNPNHNATRLKVRSGVRAGGHSMNNPLFQG